MALTTEGHEALFRVFSSLATMPWLAGGGGGYNLDVVPRSWALAFAVMSGQTLPDALPQAYRDVWRGGHTTTAHRTSTRQRRLVHAGKPRRSWQPSGLQWDCERSDRLLLCPLARQEQREAQRHDLNHDAQHEWTTG